MSGKYSRDRGKRAERQLVEYLKDKGWDAYRVPFSGAMSKHVSTDKDKYAMDVIAKRDGKIIKFEVKCRKKPTFDLAYEFIKGTPGYGIAFNSEEAIGLGEDIDEVLTLTYFELLEPNKYLNKLRRKLDSYKKWLKGEKADINVLALKTDRENFIFIWYV